MRVMSVGEGSSRGCKGRLSFGGREEDLGQVHSSRLLLCLVVSGET